MSSNIKSMKNILFFILVLSIPIFLQASDTPIDAGIILQNIKYSEPNIPLSTEHPVNINEENRDLVQSSKPFTVKKIEITGNTYFDTATLHSLVADGEGKVLPLSDLIKLAGHITDYYNKNGYPLTRAIIPAQTIHEGIVSIQIIEVTYNKINLNNTSRVNDALLQDTLSPLKEGQAITKKILDRTLLLLSDIPGVVCNATLKSGDKVATSDLMVNVAPTPMVSGSVIVDNYGNRYTGRGRISATLNVKNSFHHGDTVNISALSSGRGMNYGRISYESVVNGSGTKIGGSYSELRYKLGEPIAFLNAHGRAKKQSIWIKYPLIRTLDLNLYGRIGYDKLQLRDHIDINSMKKDRHVDNGIMSLNMDSRDTLLSGGKNAMNIDWTLGEVTFENDVAQLDDALSANTQGAFTKLNIYLARFQRLDPKSELYVDFSAQWASKNLDSSARITAGGPYSVRAYDIGVIAGDTWYSTTAEIRHAIDPFWGDKCQIIAFIDSAHITVNKNTWSTGANSANLSGIGVGFNWTGPDQLSASVYSAARIGATPTLIESTNTIRLWAEIRKGF